jgi:hypothetical protein
MDHKVFAGRCESSVSRQKGRILQHSKRSKLPANWSWR